MKSTPQMLNKISNDARETKEMKQSSVESIWIKELISSHVSIKSLIRTPVIQPLDLSYCASLDYLEKS